MFKHFRLPVAVFVLLFLSCCIWGEVGKGDSRDVVFQSIETKSLINLIFSPKDYNNQDFCVSGVLTVHYISYIYLSKADYDNLVFMNSVRIDMEWEQASEMLDLEGKYVTICGRFLANPDDSFFPYRGFIGEISHVELRRAIPDRLGRRPS